MIAAFAGIVSYFFYTEQLLPNLGRSDTLMLNGIQLHLVGECLFAGQDSLPLQVGIHHCDHRFIVRQLPDDDRHRLDTQHLTRRQSPVTGDQLVAAVRQRPCQRRGDGTHLADALDHPLHLLVVLHLEGVTLERVQLGQRNIPHPLQLGIVPLRLRGEQIVQRG